jgi:hypothetical protein
VGESKRQVAGREVDDFEDERIEAYERVGVGGRDEDGEEQKRGDGE